MTLLVLSPDYASHYRPLAVLGRAAAGSGHRVVVATGPAVRPLVHADGFEWRPLPLGPASNSGIAGADPAIERFLAATRSGPVETIRHQAHERERDLLWNPEGVGRAIAELCADLDPTEVLVDHVSFGSTLGMYASGRPFVTLVPGHPSQLPVGTERYGVPAAWPARLPPAPGQQAELERLADRVAERFTSRWNVALAALAPHRAPVADAFRVHGRRVLYNSVADHQAPGRRAALPDDHRFVGPLVRDEELPPALAGWGGQARSGVYVSLGTFLSHRGDVLAVIAAALRQVGTRAAVAAGATPVGDLGPIPSDWIVGGHLPQVALLRHVDVAIHHGGNNSVQESLAAGVGQIVLPFSTDQFANATDLERRGLATALAPNDLSVEDLVDAIDTAAERRPEAVPAPEPASLTQALFE